MHPLIIPLGLLLLATTTRNSKPAAPAGPKPTPPPGATTIRRTPAKPVPASRLKPIRTDPYAPPAPKVTIEHPDVVPAGQAPLQAAVDAAVTQAIREDEKPAQPTAAAKRTPKQAAKELQAFLLKTGRFGTMKDRPEEVKAAQRDLGLKDDGIVGKRTRLAAQKQGVALPPIN